MLADEDPTRPIGPSRPRRGAKLAPLAVSLILLVAAGWGITQDMPAIRAFILQSGWLGLLVSVPLYSSLGATAIPSEPLTLLVTGLYGPLIAALTASLGNLGAALVDYFIGCRIGAATDFQKIKQRLPFGLSKLKADSPLFLIFARMIPGYGAKAVSVFSGAMRVPLPRFLWTSAIQTVLGAFLSAYGGWSLLTTLKIIA